MVLDLEGTTDRSVLTLLDTEVILVVIRDPVTMEVIIVPDITIMVNIGTVGRIITELNVLLLVSPLHVYVRVNIFCCIYVNMLGRNS